VAGDTSCDPPVTHHPPTTPPVTPPPVTVPPPVGTGSGGGYGDPVSPVEAPGGGVSPTTDGPVPAPTTAAPATTAPSAEAVSYTSSQQSGLAMHLLPALLVIGLLGLLAAPVLVLLSRPGGMRSPFDRRTDTSGKPKQQTPPKPPTGSPS